MLTLLLVSLLCNIAIIGRFAYKHWQLYIYIHRTFWCNRPYGFTLMLYDYRDKIASSSHGIFSINIRNASKMTAWDNKMFDTGEYKKFNKVHKK